jgi:hypothetical protein
MVKRHILLCIAIVVMAGSVAASAVEFAGGTGEPNAPYQIATAEQLIALGNDPNLWDKHFVLVRDLDMAAVDPNRMHPIGDTDGHPPFCGVFDGKGHTIANLRISRKSETWVGLFGEIGVFMDSEPPPGHVRNLHMRNVNVIGQACVGGLAGSLSAGTITNCSVTGSIRGEEAVGGLVGSVWGDEITSCATEVDTWGNRAVGGLAGEVFGGIIAQCSSSGHISGGTCVGGLVGARSSLQASTGMDQTSRRSEPRQFRATTQCRSDCTVTGEEEVGGLIGWAHRSPGIEDCCALGSVSGALAVGGLVGSTESCGIVRCFARGRVRGKETAGGLIGKNQFSENAGELARYPRCQLVVEEVRRNASSNGPPSDETEYLEIYRPGFVSCFWDGEVSRIARGLGAGADAQGGLTRLTTAQMRTAASFRNFGWDFETVWTIREGEDYPRLRWDQQSSADHR